MRICSDCVGNTFIKAMESSEFLCTISETYTEMGLFDKGLEIAKVADRVYKSTRTKSVVIESILSSGNVQEALEVMKKSIGLGALRENSVLLLLLMAKILTSLPKQDIGGEDHNAANLLETFIKTDIGKKNEEGVILLATLYTTEEKYTQAIELLESKATELNSDCIFVMLGDVYTMAEDFTQAIVSYNTALSINTMNKRAKMGIKRVSEMIGLETYETEEKENGKRINSKALFFYNQEENNEFSTDMEAITDDQQNGNNCRINVYRDKESGNEQIEEGEQEEDENEIIREQETYYYDQEEENIFWNEEYEEQEQKENEIGIEGYSFEKAGLEPKYTNHRNEIGKKSKI
ncbi:hypothetical protein BB560_006712 [Smittium megazygosporum]|uniref:Uncharacterized protein n=1 Tax=Smittium megazygosporum TaxID=133381 RepID=A0A2T9Y251_9FUNG|nr:hypothetical protein BB560_006712 [Smittium megazygosporum]